MEFKEIKRYLIFNLIGSLILAALISVVTVLFGSFTEIHTKVFLTLLMFVIHSALSLAFVSDTREQTFNRFRIFTNTLFILIISSFVVSIFGLWELLTGKVVWYFYQTFGVVAFAALHGEVLSKALNKEKYLDTIIYINYIFMSIVVLLLTVIIYTPDARHVYSDVIFRILGAAGIIDGTLSILTIIFYKMFSNKNPKIETDLDRMQQIPGEKKPQKKGLSTWVWILIGFLALQFVIPLIMLAVGYFNRF